MGNATYKSFQVYVCVVTSQCCCVYYIQHFVAGVKWAMPHISLSKYTCVVTSQCCCVYYIQHFVAGVKWAMPHISLSKYTCVVTSQCCCVYYIQHFVAAHTSYCNKQLVVLYCKSSWVHLIVWR